MARGIEDALGKLRHEWVQGDLEASSCEVIEVLLESKPLPGAPAPRGRAQYCYTMQWP